MDVAILATALVLCIVVAIMVITSMILISSNDKDNEDDEQAEYLRLWENENAEKKSKKHFRK